MTSDTSLSTLNSSGYSQIWLVILPSRDCELPTPFCLTVSLIRFFPFLQLSPLNPRVHAMDDDRRKRSTSLRSRAEREQDNLLCRKQDWPTFFDSFSRYSLFSLDGLPRRSLYIWKTVHHVFQLSLVPMLMKMGAATCSYNRTRRFSSTFPFGHSRWTGMSPCSLRVPH